jgi:hypothetical protein
MWRLPTCVRRAKHSEDIKKHRYGPPPRALVDRADRIESHAAADVLAMMKHDNIPKRLKFH